MILHLRTFDIDLKSARAAQDVVPYPYVVPYPHESPARLWVDHLSALVARERGVA